jgi:membrane associated rhomboid family serine protease
MWFLELLNWLFPQLQLDSYGIRSQDFSWLPGIIIAPWLHGSWAHLMANTLPFLIFGGLILLQGVGIFWLVTSISMLVSGVGVWLFCPPSVVTVGASGIIFGYFGFLLSRGLLTRTKSAIAIFLIVIFLYGGMIWGILPSSPNVSWQAHLFGFMGGVFSANLERTRNKNH